MSKGYVAWRGASGPEIRCGAAVLAGLAKAGLNGFRRSPWGGVETGGVLFGTHEQGALRILGYRELDCEHQHGPAFELSDKDLARLEHLLADAASDETLKGLTPVGWYHSVSGREVAVTQSARKLHDRFFLEPWHVAMVLRRSKKDPVTVGFFHRDGRGALQGHSSQREFAVEDLGLKESELPVEFDSDPEPPQAPPIAEPVVEAEIAPKLQENATLAPPKRVAPPKQEIVRPPQAAAPPLNPPRRREPEPVEPADALTFFGLNQDPFSLAPDPHFFYPAPQALEASAILSHAIARRIGFVALLAESGLGKSLLLERLAEQLREQGTSVARIVNSRVTKDEFFELLAHDLQLSCTSISKTSVLIALNERLLLQSRDGQTTVLIVDNAQKLGIDVLEEIELLGNLETRSGRLLQVVLSGLPNFERRINCAELRGLRQRLISRARLAPMAEEQMGAYLEHRLAAAGLPKQRIFPPGIFSKLFLHTHGVPRLINATCGGVLQLCAESGREVADTPMLDRVSRTLDLDLVRSSADEDAEAMSA